MDGFDGVRRTTIQQYGAISRTREMTIDQLLLENRIIFLGEPIVPIVAKKIIEELLYLQSNKRDQEVSMYINSPGGYVIETLAIYDTMQSMGCPIATYCLGQAASGGAMLLMAGTKGRRFILPNAKVMLHQPTGGIGGQAEDIRIQATEILRDKKRLNGIIARHTGRTVDQVASETERDRYLSAEEALAYGVVDEILTPEKSEQMEKKKKRPVV
ncbi:MAG: ATP-dependent Clp protease proteolytic subunit [Phycisphaerales bacterium]|nr:ATP-dependent Clp protease proteolytic subunit [Phycisphaerales bacterium]